MQYNDAADPEASDGRECDALKGARRQMQAVGENRCDRANQSQHIEPQRGMDRLTDIPAQA